MPVINRLTVLPALIYINALIEGADTFQYIVYENELVTTPASTIYVHGSTQVRKRIVGNDYYIDVTLTATGFSGVEFTDWQTVLIHFGTLAVFRAGVRSGQFVVDNTLTATGFSGSENTDWENLASANGAGARTTFRDGVRSGVYVIDKELTATGFDGTEGVDWENIESHS